MKTYHLWIIWKCTLFEERENDDISESFENVHSFEEKMMTQKSVYLLPVNSLLFAAF